MPNRADRVALIRNIQKKRQSKVLTYITGDRQPVQGMIGQDAIRPMYNHLRVLGYNKVPRIDMYLYSNGGATDVPWRIITMLREHCEELNILIPYKAYSAATMIAIGGDSIVMGRKGELGPIDPSLTRQAPNGAGQENISVEDVMAYVGFLKERSGLGDQTALASSIEILANQLSPVLLGSIYRTHTHIRSTARKLLTSHAKPLEERQINAIIESLAEKTYSHGHAIGRDEAEGLGLFIVKPDEELEDYIWQLLEAYEEYMKLEQPINLFPAADAAPELVIVGCIESEHRIDAFQGNVKINPTRQMPQNLAVNANINLTLPGKLDIKSLPANVQPVLQLLLQQMQAQVEEAVKAALERQAPIIGVSPNITDAAWRNVTD